ncbi:MAG: hypothetical protein UT22_C0006G0033 [Parcubacteria group bacterium GW2011_GWC2_39_11]|nr:MAG: hypothetical protein UT22_C0006G0033 [Parcubacteria group bacterium GW2011_GWC2_39_11]
MMWQARSAWWLETKSYARISRASSAPFGRGSKNQKFPFHFLSAPPTPPAENLKLRKENFWFCFAVSVSEKSTIILKTFDCSFLHPHGETRRFLSVFGGSSKLYDFDGGWWQINKRIVHSTNKSVCA